MRVSSKMDKTAIVKLVWKGARDLFQLKSHFLGLSGTFFDIYTKHFQQNIKIDS